jgi:hypothetical protein
MSADELEQHIWKNRGRDSRQFLKEILHSGSDTSFYSISSSVLEKHRDSDLKSLMDNYGPALIQGFQVDSKFNSGSWQHIGRDTAAFLGSHAMVLIGYRYSEDGQLRFLIQNWWKKKPFVEIDSAYLKACDALVHFVETPQTEMGDYPMNMHDHVECEMLDSPEHFAPEMSGIV